MAKQKDVFGFEEFEKAFEKLQDKYDDKSEAMLHAIGKQAGKRMRQVAPVGPPKPKRKGPPLRKAYRVKKPKEYKPNGKEVKVALVSNVAYHGHLVEDGHEIYTAPKKVGKVARYNALGRRIKKISHHGRVEGKYLFDKVWKEFEGRFPKEAQQLLDEITKDLEV